jgi:hypothetical protein
MSEKWINKKELHYIRIYAKEPPSILWRMNMKLSPLAQVKKEFGSKEKLVSEVVALLKSLNDNLPEDIEKRLKSQTNLKLLKLYNNAKKVKEIGKEKVVEVILKAKRPNSKKVDEPYRASLMKYPVSKLYNLYLSAERALKKGKQA